MFCVARDRDLDRKKRGCDHRTEHELRLVPWNRHDVSVCRVYAINYTPPHQCDSEVHLELQMQCVARVIW